jgi:hypothetical protein
MEAERRSMMKKALWLSFDLGVTGDYESLYTWLADQDAVECGDSIAFVWYEPQGDLLECLKEDIKSNVEINGKSRFYVIYRTEEGKIKGTFLFGKRRQSPWTGYGSSEEESSDEE